MKIQVLVATTNQNDHSIIEKMNIQTDALIGNQCAFNSVETFDWNGHNITFYNCAERGVGLNRNTTLMRANCDICLFADDDLVYVDGYKGVVEKVFLDHPDADIIIFNLLEESRNGKERFKNVKTVRVKWYNFMRYGAARIAARFSSLKESGIYFNECFGGGCEYRHGEDTLFLSDCLKKGLKIIAVPISLASLLEIRPSTWDCGYDDKFFLDQGRLYYAISRKWWKFLCFQDAIRHRKLYKKSWLSSYKLMKKWK